jgi:Ran GTPase-activating protein (RanGAP) involved in mRNA processing and transport
VSELGIGFIAHSINNSTIRILILHFNCITDDGVEHLAEMLKTNRTLVYLGLDQNLIGERGMKYLAYALSVCNTTLKELSLVSNKSLKDSSVDSLVQILKYNRTLEELNVHDCNLTNVGKKRLQEATKDKAIFRLVTEDITGGRKQGSWWANLYFRRMK